MASAYERVLQGTSTIARQAQAAVDSTASAYFQPDQGFFQPPIVPSTASLYSGYTSEALQLVHELYRPILYPLGRQLTKVGRGLGVFGVALMGVLVWGVWELRQLRLELQRSRLQDA